MTTKQYWVERESNEGGLIPRAFFAVAFENELQYYGPAVRITSANDACLSCETFVKFGPVTPEFTELIYERLVRRGQKTGVFY